MSTVNFAAFPPSARTMLLGWVALTPRLETRATRIATVAEAPERNERARSGSRDHPRSPRVDRGPGTAYPPPTGVYQRPLPGRMSVGSRRIGNRSRIRASILGSRYSG
jgi:hypothetical protein